MTDRLQVLLALLIMALALALAGSAIDALASERQDCARLNGGPVATRWSVARGCWAQFYPSIAAPIGGRPMWLRLP